MRVCNFKGSGHNLTKFYRQMWLIAGVIKWTLILQTVPPYKIWEGKKRPKFSVIFDYFRLWSQISLERIDISKIGRSATFHPLLCEKIPWTNNKVIDAHVDPPNWTFLADYISAPRGRWPLKFFLHMLDTGQGLLVHTTNRVGGPPKILRVNIWNWV